MSKSITKARQTFHQLSKVLLFAMLAVAAVGQNTTTTSIKHGTPSFETTVKNAEVVYVEGNDLVLKQEDGSIEHLVVPSSDRFYVGGKTLSVSDLKTGTKLTQTITTATTPRYVNSVRVLKGKVWHVSAPHSIIITLPDHTNHRYEVPSHAKFTVNGQPKTVFEVRKGMNIQATIVSDSTESIVSRGKFTSGVAPKLPPQPLAGVLLLQAAPAAPVAPLTTLARVERPAQLNLEEPARELPKTGSLMPLFGLLGTLALASSIGLRTLRKRLTIL